MRRISAALSSVSMWFIVGIWAACVGAHAAYYIISILARAEDIGDLYARSRGYQLVMFGIFRLPIWLGLLLALMLLRGSPQTARARRDENSV